MKKLPVFFIFLFTAVVFSSCSHLPGISLTKRNYRSGYYLDFISGKYSGPESMSKDELKDQPADLPLNIIPEGNLLNPPPLYAETGKKTQRAMVIGKNDNHANNQNRFQTNHNIIIKPPALKNKLNKYRQGFRPMIAEHGNSAGINHEGGGIIWTLIGILVLLWLLSLLTGGWGLGGLIYIFLVVAVILAILRLLDVL